MSSLFSIITVCLNDLDGLVRTQKSIRSQSNADYEWIVIDGASHDGTPEFLAQLSVAECRWLSEPDRGLYDAMNKGIDKATGQYLLFLNSGDEFATPDVLQEVSSNLPSDSMVDLVYGDSLERNNEGAIIYKKARHHKYLWYGMFTHHQAIFYRRKALGSLRYSASYPIGADYGLTAELIIRGALSQYVPKPVCIFERGGISAKNIPQGAADQFSIRRDILHYSPVVCAMIRFLHAMVRTIKVVAPPVYQSLRFSKKVRT